MFLIDFIINIIRCEILREDLLFFRNNIDNLRLNLGMCSEFFVINGRIFFLYLVFLFYVWNLLLVGEIMRFFFLDVFYYG